MARKTSTFGNVKKGVLSIVERDKFMDSLHTLKDGMVKLTVEVIGDKRSNRANGYYWAVVCEMIAEAMSEAAGRYVSREEAHAEIKRHCIKPQRIVTENGYEFIMPGSTADMDTYEFSETIELARNWGADFWGIDIPDPVRLETANQALKA